MTPKQRVLKKYPRAYSYEWRDSWCIYRPYSGGNLDLGDGKTAALAWADAAKKLRQSSTGAKNG